MIPRHHVFLIANSPQVIPPRRSTTLLWPPKAFCEPAVRRFVNQSTARHWLITALQDSYSLLRGGGTTMIVDLRAVEGELLSLLYFFLRAVGRVFSLPFLRLFELFRVSNEAVIVFTCLIFSLFSSIGVCQRVKSGNWRPTCQIPTRLRIL